MNDFLALAEHYRQEHDATHGEAEMCGAECLVLGLAEFESAPTADAAALREMLLAAVETLPWKSAEFLKDPERAVSEYRAAVLFTIHATPAPTVDAAALDEPDPNRRGMPKCPCGDIAFRPEPIGTRLQAWRCGGCHRTLSRCDCAALRASAPGDEAAPYGWASLTDRAVDPFDAAALAEMGYVEGDPDGQAH